MLYPPNGSRYLLVGGTRQRDFVGIHFQPRKMPENAATPTRQVHQRMMGHHISRKKQ
jgi:hypothetical protein